MSAFPPVRRADKAMPDDHVAALLREGYCGRLATVGADGYPYCVPLLFVWMDGKIYLHNAKASGHLRTNIEHCAKVCFEVDHAGAVYDYGRFECDSTIAYRSLIAFGKVAIVEEEVVKAAFFDALLAKYRKAGPERPKGFYPRLKATTVYEMTVERITGKETPLVDVSEQWPAKDQTKSPNAVPPR